LPAIFFAAAFFAGAGGTFLPARRASDKPIAIACFGFVTFLLLLPDFSFPRFISCSSVSTCAEAAGLYLRALLFLDAAFFVAIAISKYRKWEAEMERQVVSRYHRSMSG
jgi:hypothetical protein